MMNAFVVATMMAATTTTTQAFHFNTNNQHRAVSIMTFSPPPTTSMPYFNHHIHLPTTKKTFALFASENNNDEDFGDEYTDSLSQEGENAQAAARSMPPPSPPPQPIGQNAQTKRLDPLMASLTRTDPSVANLPTRNVPFFGEVPVDGSLTVLIPAAVIAVLGFVLSIVVAFNSKDLLVSTLNQVSDEISSTAVRQSNQKYDESVCRGICSSQQDDLEGLKKFMGALKKND